MNRVLLVDDDRELHKLLGAHLSKYQSSFEIVHADTGQKALDILERENISVLITDVVMPDIDGLQLLAHMNKQYPDIPCIVITSYSLPMLTGRLLSKVFHYIKKPISPPELSKTIIRALEQPQEKGNLGQLSVAGILQLVEMEEKTCLLDVHLSGERQGSLVIVEGELHNAVCGKLIGEEAALNLLCLDEVQVSRRALPEKKIVRRIHKSNQNLLLNAMHLKDSKEDDTADKERKKSQKQLDEGIALCQRLEFKKSQKSLFTILKGDRNNFLAWLWFSRTLTDMKRLKMALTEVHKLQPDYPEMLEDIKKIRSSDIVPYTKLTRCPFCYAPVDVQAPWCHYCKSNLLVDASTFSQMYTNTVHPTFVQQALERFEKVLDGELNTKLLFYAGAACLNLGKFNKALTYFDLLLPIIPPDNPYKKMVGQVVEFIASNQQHEETETHTEKNQDEQAEENQEQKQLVTKKPTQKTILVVEDSSTTRKVIKMTLENGGFRIIEAIDGVEALSKLNDERPDLVLLDIMLPKIDGYNILSILKRNKEMKTVPVIMLTGKNRILDKVKGKLSSANAYLTKPFKPEVLINAVNKHIH